MYLNTVLQLPYCHDAKAISIACLDLRYSVTVLKSHDLEASHAATLPVSAQMNRLMLLAAAFSSSSDSGNNRGDADEGDRGRREVGGAVSEDEKLEIELEAQQRVRKSSKRSNRKEIVKGKCKGVSGPKFDFLDETLQTQPFYTIKINIGGSKVMCMYVSVCM